MNQFVTGRIRSPQAESADREATLLSQPAALRVLVPRTRLLTTCHVPGHPLSDRGTSSKGLSDAFSRRSRCDRPRNRKSVSSRGPATTTGSRAGCGRSTSDT